MEGEMSGTVQQECWPIGGHIISQIYIEGDVYLHIREPIGLMYQKTTGTSSVIRWFNI